MVEEEKSVAEKKIGTGVRQEETMDSLKYC
jgi:hypothetical protein